MSDAKVDLLPFLRNGVNYDRDAASFAAGTDCGDEVVTVQASKEECDINVIVKRFGLTGELPENFKMPVSGDFTFVGDYQSAMQVMRASDQAFMQVPAELRARFGNDPQQLMDFLENVDNRDEALKLGLLQKPPEKTRDAVMAIDELAAALKPKA